MPEIIELKTDPSSTKLSAFVLDRHVGPNLGSLTSSAKVPALTEQPDTFASWVANQVFTGEIKDDRVRILTSVFMSRIWSARDAYEAARSSLDQWTARVEQTNTHINTYRAAVRSFESAILHAHLGVTAMKRLLPLIGAAPPYVLNDGSDYDRLRRMANRIKHFEDDIANGEHTLVAPMWLTDTALVTTDASLTYFEFAELLDVHAKDAKMMSEDIFTELQIPRDAKPVNED